MSFDGTSERSVTVFSAKVFFHQFTKVFSLLRKFPAVWRTCNCSIQGVLFYTNLKVIISTCAGQFGLARDYYFLMQTEPVTEVKDEENSATTAMTTGDQSAAMEGYKRKMDDQEGSRAAKNPRSSSPTFSSLEVSI